MGSFSFDSVDWLAVVIAFVVTFAFGWFWYSDRGFFPVWKKAGNITDEQVKNANMGMAFGGTFVANVLGIIVLAALMASLEITGWWAGLLFGGLIGLVFRGGAHALHNGFAVRKPVITLIDTAHDASALAIAGLIIGLMA